MVYATGDENVMGWQLLGFSLETDELVSELPFGRAEFLAIRELFDYGDDEWFTASYLVTSDLWPRLETVLGCGPPREGLEYHVEAYAKKGTT